MNFTSWLFAITRAGIVLRLKEYISVMNCLNFRDKKFGSTLVIMQGGGLK